MTKLLIRIRKQSLTIEQAVEQAILDSSPDIGVIENLRAALVEQSRMMGRMLNVQFSQYEEDFSAPEYYPKTDAEKLSYILGTTALVLEE